MHTLISRGQFEILHLCITGHTDGISQLDSWFLVTRTSEFRIFHDVLDCRCPHYLAIVGWITQVLLFFVGIGPRRAPPTSNLRSAGTCGRKLYTARAAAIMSYCRWYAPCPPPRPSAMLTSIVAAHGTKTLIPYLRIVT